MTIRPWTLVAAALTLAAYAAVAWVAWPTVKHLATFVVAPLVGGL